jgi:hypothetical protein
VLVAQQLATLAGLAPRRVLPVSGLKPDRPVELAAFPGAARPPGRRLRRREDSANCDNWKSTDHAPTLTTQRVGTSMSLLQVPGEPGTS